MSFTFGDPAFVGAVTPAGPAYDVLTAIPWAHAFWAGGPEFAALALADGGSVATWPCELTAVAMSTVVGTPTYRAAAASMGGRPSVEAFGTEVMNTAITSIPQPWTVVVVGRSAAVGGSFAGSPTNSLSSAGLRRTSFAAGVALAGTDSGSSAVQLWEGHANGASSALYVNGSSNATGDAGLGSIARATAFSRSSAAATTALTGHIAFIGYIGRALTSGERSALTSWARSHYGTP